MKQRRIGLPGPLELALQWQLRNDWLRWRALGMQAWLALAALIAALGAALRLIHPYLPALVDIAGSHLPTCAVVIGIQASLLVHWRRRRLINEYHSNWLSGLPVSARRLSGVIALRSAAAPLLVLLLIAVAVTAGRAAVREPGASAHLLLAVGFATLVGSLLGWFFPTMEGRRARREPVHGVPVGAPVGASLRGLSGWSDAQSRSYLSARLLARFTMLVMLSIPIGVPGNVAVAVIAVWGIALYLGVLLRATIAATTAGAAWLRPTPVSFLRFAWGVTWMPAFRQVLWTLVAMLLLVGLGCAPAVAARIAEWWLAAVTVTSSITVAQAFRSGSTGVRILSALIVIAVAERIRAYAAWPTAVVISAWHHKRAAGQARL